jgi:hypothetical protein
MTTKDYIGTNIYEAMQIVGHRAMNYFKIRPIYCIV